MNILVRYLKKSDDIILNIKSRKKNHNFPSFSQIPQRCYAFNQVKYRFYLRVANIFFKEKDLPEITIKL